MRINPYINSNHNVYSSQQSLQKKEAVKTTAEQSKIQKVEQNNQPKTEQINKQKVENKEQLNMSSREMKIRTEAVKNKEIQDNVSMNHVSQSAIATLQNHGKSLMNLSNQHKEAKGEDKLKIEAKAKNVFKEMKNILDATEFKGQKALKIDDLKIPKVDKKTDMNKLLNSDFIQKKVSEPLDKAKKETSSKIENLSNSIKTESRFTKEDAVNAIEQLKSDISGADIKSISANLDDKRQNVQFLLK